jgi:hypothetical protein
VTRICIVTAYDGGVDGSVFRATSEYHALFADIVALDTQSRGDLLPRQRGFRFATAMNELFEYAETRYDVIIHADADEAVLGIPEIAQIAEREAVYLDTLHLESERAARRFCGEFHLRAWPSSLGMRYAPNPAFQLCPEWHPIPSPRSDARSTFYHIGPCPGAHYHLKYAIAGSPDMDTVRRDSVIGWPGAGEKVSLLPWATTSIRRMLKA